MKREAGFTLLEVLIVILLIAFISAVAIPNLSKVFRTSKESFARQTATLLKEARDRALLLGKVVRLHVDLDKQEFWLEEAPGNYLLPSAQEEEKKRREEREAKEGEKKESAFRMVKELTKEKRALPNGLKIKEILTPRSKKPAEEGSVDVYFFPNGSADGAILHLEDEEGAKSSLLIHPVTGLTKLRDGFLEEDKE